MSPPLLYSLYDYHVRDAEHHPLHFVACDCQIYQSAWQRIDEALASGQYELLRLFPVPGLWHLCFNYLECVYKFLWDPLLGPAAAVLGRRRPTWDCRNFDACEELLEVVSYGIVRFVRTHFGDASLLDVLNHLEDHDRPTHYVLFSFVHLICPFFQLRAMIRARDFTDLVPLLKFMLPTFLAARHTNYASAIARFLMSFQLSLPAVQVMILHTLASSFLLGDLNGQASDVLLERVRVVASRHTQLSGTHRSSTSSKTKKKQQTHSQDPTFTPHISC